MRVQAAALALFLFACPLAGATPRVHVVETVRLRIGVVPYDDPAQSTQWKDTEGSLNAYFDEVERAQIPDAPVRFELTVVHGNYYQVLEWMRDGKIDGAVVSSFSAFLLQRDSTLDLAPVAELVRATDSYSGGPVIVRMTGKTTRPPLNALNDCLDHIRDSLNDPQPIQQCKLKLVNHLSTTGFVLPLLYVSQYITRFHLKAEQEQAYWERLLEWSRFTLWHGDDQSPPEIPSFSFSYKGKGAPLNVDVPRLNDALLISRRVLRNGRRQYADRALPPSMNPDGTVNANSVWIAAGSAMNKYATDPQWTGYRA